MRITSKGQVTIPIEIRERLGMRANTEVEFQLRGDAVVVRKTGRVGGRGKRLVQAMRGKATTGLSTDEIMALTRG
ncbi:MAG: AbrB family transcriptional regulator [Candidatus Muproteobacteria bacterium RBG_16_65_34]|uniref:AbrB family transcriptional regulator n=1 Tax=Candidatus Muproteobacteria bacterium RBG_16_65_34 TaxID=1817760 RepID=A0A1F6TMR7_9PROT|nr:MAG: AbrB family transcriptional regulator [Candidatus Muproteobacteria bacterium RBG_16_65_34]